MKKLIALLLFLVFDFVTLFAEDAKSIYQEKLEMEANALFDEASKKQDGYKIKMMRILASCKEAAEVDGVQYACEEIRRNMYEKEMDFVVERVLIKERYEKAAKTEAMQSESTLTGLSLFIGPSGNLSSVVGTLLGDGDEDTKASKKPKSVKK